MFIPMTEFRVKHYHIKIMPAVVFGAITNQRMEFRLIPSSSQLRLGNKFALQP